jgi:hypothetical protein
MRRTIPAPALSGWLLLGSVPGICAWRHFVGPHHPRIAAAGLYVGAAFRIALALHNVRTPNIVLHH